MGSNPVTSVRKIPTGLRIAALGMRDEGGKSRAEVRRQKDDPYPNAEGRRQTPILRQKAEGPSPKAERPEGTAG